MLLNTLFLCIDSSWFNIFSTSAIIFITCQNPNHITNRMTYRGNINNTFVTIFLIGRPAITNFSYFRWLFPLCKFKVPFLFLEVFLVCYDSIKLPRWYLRENLQEVFVILIVVVILHLLEVFHSLLFDFIHHPSVSYFWIFTPI